MELIFAEDNFLIKTLSTHEEVDAALRLRHDVFREELKWVEPSEDGLDRDEYDAFSQGIGVFNEKNEIIGHVRLISAPDPFMIEKDFSSLLPEDNSFKKNTGMAEATRTCIRKDVRTDRYSSMTMAHLIYKALYHWSKQHESTELVTIVERRYYLLLKRSKFPFKPVGEFTPIGDGMMSGVITLKWSEFDEVVKEKRPDFYDWFVNLPDFAPSRLLSRGLY